MPTNALGQLYMNNIGRNRAKQHPVFAPLFRRRIITMSKATKGENL